MTRVLGLDGAVHDGEVAWESVDEENVECVYRLSCAPIVAMRKLTRGELDFFSRWCPLCFPRRT